MTKPQHNSAADAKKAGWFSRRHHTRDDHDRAIEEHKANQPPRPKQVWNKSTKSWEKVNA